MNQRTLLVLYERTLHFCGTLAQARALYEVIFELPSLSIVCYSSIVTGMGVQNFLSESCSVTATALLR